mmetsp:Transcript_68464/g.139230  ORF Transcript_68464/g.139230 Transcript_68464/m.139230 type:complete len:82 (-) Transcript_68464:560-805(-)
MWPALLAAASGAAARGLWWSASKLWRIMNSYSQSWAVLLSCDALTLTSVLGPGKKLTSDLEPGRGRERDEKEHALALLPPP